MSQADAEYFIAVGWVYFAIFGACATIAFGLLCGAVLDAFRKHRDTTHEEWSAGE